MTTGYYVPSALGGNRIIVPRVALATAASISVTEASIGSVQDTNGGEQILLTATYTKGTEAGVDLYVKFFDDSDGTTKSYDFIGENIGGGILISHLMKFRLDATQVVDIPLSARGRRWFQVYQISDGALGGSPGTILVEVTVTGTSS